MSAGKRETIRREPARKRLIDYVLEKIMAVSQEKFTGEYKITLFFSNGGVRDVKLESSESLQI